MEDSRRLTIIKKIVEKPCMHCGGVGILKTTWDREQVICLNCSIRTIVEVGDYYDEGFMDGRYVIPQWNRGKLFFDTEILK